MLDSKSNIEEYIRDFCKEKNYAYQIETNSNTTRYYLVDYGDESKPLRIEVSFRPNNISTECVEKVNGMMVYSVNELAAQKALAYISRDTIEDLYDVSFIVNNYFNELSSHSKARLEDSVFRKGTEQLAYIISTHKSNLIDPAQLEKNFLSAYGILSENLMEKPFNS